MRHPPSPGQSLGRPRRFVGVTSETVSSFGRSVLRGVIQYANLKRDWVIHKDMWGVDPDYWPNCDGIVLGGAPPELYEAARQRCRHMVSCSGNLPPDVLPIVCLDDEATGALAAVHLMERGLTSFGFYGDNPTTRLVPNERPRYTFDRRAQGFYQALTEREFEPRRCGFRPAFGEFLSHAHHGKLIEWVRSLPKPVGIMAADDPHARDLAEACRVAGIPIPDQVALIGVNNDELLCESTWPPLTSVECNFARMGHLAAKTLDRLIHGEVLAPEERLVQLPPVRIQQRMSTDMLAVDSPEVAAAIRFIREHACDPCTVGDVMRVTPVARRTLERKFAEQLDRTVHDEIVRVRVETAKRLLTHPDLSLDQIGERCGFSTLSSFTRFFHAAAGVTPAALRRRTGRNI